MNDDRIIELLSDLLDESRGTNKRLDTTVDRLDTTIDRLDTTIERLDGIEGRVGRIEDRVTELAQDVTVIKRDVGRLQKQQADTNVMMKQMQLAVVTLADHFEGVLDFGQRLARVEAAVFKN